MNVGDCIVLAAACVLASPLVEKTWHAFTGIRRKIHKRRERDYGRRP